MIPLGQTDGQRALAALEPVVAATAERALVTSLDEAAAPPSAPNRRACATRPSTHDCSGARRCSFTARYASASAARSAPARPRSWTRCEGVARPLRDRRDHQRHLHQMGCRNLVRSGALAPERIAGVETGGCPHTAIREDASINLAAVEDMRRNFPALDLVLIESGGDNLAATFSPELADLTVYVIDVAAGDKIPSKGGPGITRSDLLVINKIDLAPSRCLARSDGARRQAHARRAALRLQQSANRAGCRRDRGFHRTERRIGSVGWVGLRETQHFGQQLAIVGSREELDPTYGPPPGTATSIFKYASTSARWAG